MRPDQTLVYSLKLVAEERGGREQFEIRKLIADYEHACELSERNCCEKYMAWRDKAEGHHETLVKLLNKYQEKIR